MSRTQVSPQDNADSQGDSVPLTELGDHPGSLPTVVFSTRESVEPLASEVLISDGFDEDQIQRLPGTDFDVADLPLLDGGSTMPVSATFESITPPPSEWDVSVVEIKDGELDMDGRIRCSSFDAPSDQCSWDGQGGLDIALAQGFATESLVSVQFYWPRVINDSLETTYAVYSIRVGV